jgi:hypothetical protein
MKIILFLAAFMAPVANADMPLRFTMSGFSQDRANQKGSAGEAKLDAAGQADTYCLMYGGNLSHARRLSPFRVQPDTKCYYPGRWSAEEICNSGISAKAIFQCEAYHEYQ